MARGEIHFGDVGIIFRSTIRDQDGSVLDVSSATLKKLTFQKPGGLTFDKTATFTTDGTDGKIQYAIEDGVLDVVGDWEYQGAVTLDDGGPYHSDIKQFNVLANLA